MSGASSRAISVARRPVVPSGIAGVPVCTRLMIARMVLSASSSSGVGATLGTNLKRALNNVMRDLLMMASRSGSAAWSLCLPSIRSRTTTAS